MTTILQDNDLMKMVPSAFSRGKHERTSSRYEFLPTIDVVTALKESGFMPVKATQKHPRDEERAPFVRHMIRFRQECDLVKSVNDMVPEIVLVNSHDGHSCYHLRAGIYRMVCSNGLVVGNDQFHYKVRHQGAELNQVIQSAIDLATQFPKTLEIAEKWREIDVSPGVKLQYAERASEINWKKEEYRIDPNLLLIPRRGEDKANDLWTLFNVVQEHIIKGGVSYTKTLEDGKQRKGKTRPVNAVPRDINVNTALWNLTQEVADLLV
jgi:hypothetical protein